MVDFSEDVEASVIIGAVVGVEDGYRRASSATPTTFERAGKGGIPGLSSLSLSFK